jgi:chromosome segregation ATPase
VGAEPEAGVLDRQCGTGAACESPHACSGSETERSGFSRVFPFDVEQATVATKPAQTDELSQTDEHQSLSYWLDDIPRTLFGGFDRRATRQLVARLDASYWELLVQREHLVAELTRAQTLCEELEKREHRLSAEAESLTGELESANQERASLADQLERARSKWDTQLARARADLERELEEAQDDLAAYRRREILLADVVSSAKRRAEAVTSEARDEAERMLRKARAREAEIVRNAERELARLETERRRLQTIAADLRQDLSARLVATLEELNCSEVDRDAPNEAGSAPREESPTGRGDSETR